MGVPWGIVAGNPRYTTREEIIAQWRPLALHSDDGVGFNIMFGTDRIHFERREIGGTGRFEPVVTTVEDPETAAKLSKLNFGDGTHEEFERLFDGYEIFVPWDAFDRIDAPGCVAHGKRVDVVGDLLYNLRSRDFDEMDTDLAQLARWLLAAAEVAHECDMIISISY